MFSEVRCAQSTKWRTKNVILVILYSHCKKPQLRRNSSLEMQDTEMMSLDATNTQLLLTFDFFHCTLKQHALTTKANSEVGRDCAF